MQTLHNVTLWRQRVCLNSVVAKGANVLQQRFSLLRPSCVAVGGVAEFRPAILHFILKQLCCVVKS